ncbi:tripartite tricarboxylate transporter substrate-binding protein [Sphaerotilus microaerophilus]|uniref:MFS transporter n=1 Tax=Sphaerotilus microaerophilus TaxID=2914710 RepID=A0ABM7YPM4_9BURK|nr:tripartite tricarboxylate transporter substrate-binding protein [Sphaerotilus sp. FB-5]BDI06473.1 MFS transporter [Sphaerotilus sp. FB-5]
MTSHPILRRSLLGLAAATLCLALPLGVQAQGDKPIRLLVGFPPGGASDSVARVLAEKLQVLLKQQVIVENRPGVGGRIAAQAVKNAAPDGLTYMVAPNATFVFQHLTYPVSVLGYDMTTDFTSVAQINSYPMAMVVNAGIGVKNAKDYAAWLKANPDKGTFGTAGQGGDTHFNGLQFAKVAGVKMTVVPYRGNGPLVTDLVGGQILTGNMVAGDALQHVKSGKLTYVGVYAPKRSPLLPDVPTMAEQGFDTGGDNGWMGLWGPAKLPKAELDRMQGALKHVLAQPEVKDLMMNRFAQIADYRPGAEADKQLKAELAHWGPVIKASGFTPAQ